MSRVGAHPRGDADIGPVSAQAETIRVPVPKAHDRRSGGSADRLSVPTPELEHLRSDAAWNRPSVRREYSAF